MCGEAITAENDSKEHIIPNAIGGLKKVKGFLCHICNTDTGDEWDVELAKQLNPLSLFFSINRDRGTVPSQQFPTESGRSFVLNADGSLGLPKPKYEKTTHENGVRISINARNMDEARKMLKGVARKYPQADIDDLLKNAKSKSEYCDEYMQFNLSLGGLDAGRSLVKSTLTLIHSAGKNPFACEKALDFLKSENAEPCFGYFYDKDLVQNRPVGVPIHCVYVEADPETKLIKAYVEYFGVLRVVCCLSNQYDGETYSCGYSLNPVTGEVVKLQINFDLGESEIRQAYGYEKYDPSVAKNAIDSVIGPALKTASEKEQNRVLENAVKFAFENCGAKYGEAISEEQHKKLVGLLLERLQPWLVSQIVRGGFHGGA